MDHPQSDFEIERERLNKLQEALEEAYPSTYIRNLYHVVVRSIGC
jgi:hypothetical protein